MSISTGSTAAAVSSANNAGSVQKSSKHHHGHHHKGSTSIPTTKADSVQISDQAKALAKAASAEEKNK
jgi:hypothetical protein